MNPTHKFNWDHLRSVISEVRSADRAVDAEGAVPIVGVQPVSGACNVGHFGPDFSLSMPMTNTDVLDGEQSDSVAHVAACGNGSGVNPPEFSSGEAAEVDEVTGLGVEASSSRQRFSSQASMLDDLVDEMDGEAADETGQARASLDLAVNDSTDAHGHIELLKQQLTHAQLELRAARLQLSCVNVDAEGLRSRLAAVEGAFHDERFTHENVQNELRDALAEIVDSRARADVLIAESQSKLEAARAEDDSRSSAKCIRR